MVNKERIIYCICGRIMNVQNNQGIPNLDVEVWDRDVYYDILIGTSVTNEQGRFYLDLNEADCQEFYMDDHPHLYFRIFNQGNLVEHTEVLTLGRDLQFGENQFIFKVNPYLSEV